MSTPSGSGGRRPHRRRAKPADIAAFLRGDAGASAPAIEYVPTTLPGPDDPFGLQDAVARLLTPRTEHHGAFLVCVAENGVAVSVSDHACRMAIGEAATAMQTRAAADNVALPEDVAALVEALSTAPTDEEPGAAAALDELHVYDAETLITLRGGMASWNKDHHDRDVGLLLTWLELAPIFLDTKRLERIATGSVAFSELSVVFRKGQAVVAERGHADEDFAGVVRSVAMRNGFMSRFLQIKLEVVASRPEGGARRCMRILHIPEFEGLRNMASVSVRPLTAAVAERLAVRGRKFREFVSTDAAFLSYDGLLRIPGWMGERTLRAAGRVMVDAVGIGRFDPDVARRISEGLSDGDGHDDFGSDSTAPALQVRDEDLPYCWPTLPAFSFRCRQWGEINVNGLTAISFRTNAIEQLVLEPSRKRMIVALVRQGTAAFTDVIDGKSGGLVFLLHGTPGVGKTLTAEAVAESLRRPLYSISVGELGTEPDALEERLRQILDMAERWGAVLLLDEADIFLEQRDEHDIVRNAMVGVFLRLLEYHTGVMFLTTNRVRRFDQAFHSRIAMALHYKPMDTATRQAVWHNLLQAAGVPGIDAAEVAHLHLNGRQIKTAIRLAQTLAGEAGHPVSACDLVAVAAFGTAFEQHVSKEHSLLARTKRWALSALGSRAL